jgi:hypothetical protein
MKMGGKVRGLTVALTIFSALGVAFAQGEPAAPAPAPAPATEPEPTALSPQQMLANAKGFLPAMDRNATQVRRQLTRAREQKDVVKALCLNDKLNQMDLAIRTATDRVSGLEAAVSANDVERSRHQYTVILVLRDRVTTLNSESNQCIGEETGFVGESAVTVEVEGVPDTDPSEFPTPPVVSQPPVTSVPAPPPVDSPSMPET